METKTDIKIYAGIGSRDTPEHVYKLMVQIASYQAKKGTILRTGAANGADSAFIEGHFKETNTNLEIYIPFFPFNGYHPENDRNVHSGTCWKSESIAEKYHPRWDILKPAVKKLMARNSYQVLGKNLKTPVDFVICWTPFTRKGDPKGGTSQAIRIAEAYNIPVINLGHKNAYENMKEVVKGLD